jgi:putative nucleotidyltransferase with HDIG domain
MVALNEIAWIPGPPTWQLDWPTVLAHCPWLSRLAATPQDSRHHAEGDVLTHTRMVAEALIGLAGWRSLPTTERAQIFVAALFHDIGKPATTQIEPDGRISSHGHARVGAALARTHLWNNTGLGFPIALHEREQVARLVRLHGLPIWFLDKPDLEWAIISASLVVQLEQVALLAEADVRGRICSDQAELLARIDLFRSWCAEHGCLQTAFEFPSDHGRVRYCRKRQSDPSYAPYDDTWGTVTILSGIPGSGKDTWLHNQRDATQVISLDAIRAEHAINPEDPQGPVIQIAKEQAREFLRRKQPFIWNATNLTRRIRDPLIDLCLDYTARVRIVYIDAVLEEALARNQQRAAPVPEHVIRQLAAKTEPPDLREAHGVSWIAEGLAARY